MAETGVRYTVTVAKQGNGAAEAAAELQALGRAAATTNAGLNTSGAQLATLTATTKTTTTVMRGLGGVLTLAGLQQFPQLTTAAMLTKSSLDAVRMSGTTLTAGLGLTTAGIAGLGAAIVSATFAWKAYKAEQLEAASTKALNEQTKRFTEDLREQVAALQAAGRITIEQRQQLMGSLRSPTAGGNQGVRDFIGDLDRGTASERLQSQQLRFAQQDALAAMNAKGVDRLQQSLQIQDRYNEELKLQKQLLEQGLITQQQWGDMAVQSDTKRMNSLARLNTQLTDTQQLARDVAQAFASGLSSAIVNAFREGGKALQQFAAQFLAAVAQMIMQVLILRALKSVFPSIFPAASGAVIMAANGVAGVSEVSGATYFPKFNTVAGEAGREMFTVLARPRFMEVGGMSAVVGNAGPNKLAITDADALAARGGAGAGGNISITVTMEPGLRGEIVENSVSGAVVRVTQEMSRDSKLSRVTKQL